MQQLQFLLFDVDKFKEVNDKYGHLVGDLCLKQIGQLPLISRCISIRKHIGMKKPASLADEIKICFADAVNRYTLCKVTDVIVELVWV